ncbi:RNA polymerase sigma factor [Butyrivibrio sp. VCB2001]|jgi:RNA polymerase sigma-70 factor (ECF subfamily)|uniref:RNA polymerase sigma factor n=1 Tax=Butyrivibrio sp. VCB2001 TaxID=1280667 RepID=UPI000408D091|nr:RNA polymerase sigma factor [Butyrivibrio sp. VCB2001]
MDIEEQYDKIFRFCYYRVHNTDTAQDLTQETFLRFMNSSYEERGEQLRFLYTIARNLCIDESRKAQMEELPEDYSDEGDGAEDLIRRMDVNAALDKMPEEDRELLILRYMNEVPLSDICKIMGISRFALYRKLNSVKRDFIKLMEGGNLHE